MVFEPELLEYLPNNDQNHLPSPTETQNDE